MFEHFTIMASSYHTEEMDFMQFLLILAPA